MNKIDLNRRDAKCVEARSAGTLGRSGGRDGLAIRVPATTPRTVPKNQLFKRIPPEGTDDIPWESNSVTMTEMLVCRLSWRD